MKTQTQDQNDTTLSYENLAFLVVTSMAILGPTLRYYLLRSKNVEPIVFCEGNFVHFEIPQNTQREILSGSGLETEVVEMRIEFRSQNPQTQERFEPFTLTKASPSKNDLRITPGKYLYKCKTLEKGHSWSGWSEYPIISKPALCKAISADFSRAKNQEEAKSVENGPDFKVLVAGKGGSGKSSLINSLVSAIQGQWKKVAHTGPESLTNTQSLMKYDLTPGKAFYDMPGWEFDLDLFKKIVEGKLNDDDINVPQLQKYSQKCLHGCSHEAEQISAGNGTKFDVVILVISATCLEGHHAFYQEIINLLRPLGIPCIGVLTKLDEIDSGRDRISRKKFLEDARSFNLCRGISLDSIFPLVNYSEDETTDLGVDEHLLHLVKKAQEKSQFRKLKVRN